MKLRYAPRAIRQMDSIAAYIVQENPSAAKRVGARLQRAITRLVQFPGMGRVGALVGTRELIVPGLPYLVVYRVEATEIVVLGVYHGAQLRPGQTDL